MSIRDRTRKRRARRPRSLDLSPKGGARATIRNATRTRKRRSHRLHLPRSIGETRLKKARRHRRRRRRRCVSPQRHKINKKNSQNRVGHSQQKRALRTEGWALSAESRALPSRKLGSRRKQQHAVIPHSHPHPKTSPWVHHVAARWSPRKQGLGPEGSTVL